MDFEFSAEQEMFRRTIRNYVRKECPPEKEREREERGEFAADLYGKMAALGLLGVLVPQEYGGLGGQTLDAILLLEELSYGSQSSAGAFAFCNLYGVTKILYNGTEEQKREYLPKLASGEIKMCVACTEPDAGTGIGGIRTKAVMNGDNFVITGTKTFINNAHVADCLITACVTDKKEEEYKNMSLVILPTNDKGIRTSPIRKMGNRATPSCEVVIEDVVVPQSNLLGGMTQINLGWRAMRKTLDMERTIFAAGCVGLAQAAYEEALQYAKTRRQGGVPVGDYQAVMHKLTDMAVKVHTARLLVYHTGWMLGQGWPAAANAAMAKVYASDVCKQVCLDGLQIMGGAGYVCESNMQRYLREAVLNTIVGGTNEVQRNTIGMALELGLPRQTRMR
ncbi:MAG: acyl-CoA dehydrogenase family protein [Candidatus Binatia bacterium]